MGYMRQAQQNAANEKAAAQLSALKRDAEAFSIADSARAEGANLGYRQGIQEGEMQMASFAEQLQKLFGARNTQERNDGLAHEFNREAQHLHRQMEDDARRNAFRRAQQMGDTSEENVNILLDEELRYKGL